MPRLWCILYISWLAIVQILTEWSEDVGMIHKMCAANQLAECHDGDDVVMKPGTEHRALQRPDAPIIHYPRPNIAATTIASAILIYMACFFASEL